MLIKLTLMFTIVMTNASSGDEGKSKNGNGKEPSPISFKKEVFPILQKNCMPCHAEENYNPSEFFMDNYDLIKTGGVNGPVFVEGKSAESLIIKKLGTKPPVGDRMPMNSKKKIAAGKAKWLSDGDIKTIATWIDEGAKQN